MEDGSVGGSDQLAPPPPITGQELLVGPEGLIACYATVGVWRAAQTCMCEWIRGKV